MTTMTVVDLFAGAGGTTCGLKDAGADVIAAIENDADACASYRLNHPEVALIERDIQRVRAPEMARRLLVGHRLGLLSACPPCQGFSTLGPGRNDDPRNALVEVIRRFVDAFAPRIVALENVPGLARDKRFERLLNFLGNEYKVASYVIDAADLGVPQHRRRMIVLAVDRALRSPPDDLTAALPDDYDPRPVTAGEALAALRDYTQHEDPLHRSRNSRPLTLRRIEAAPPGGGRRDLPSALQLKCHAGLGRSAATSIYGRIDPNAPAPTMTTRCTTPSCGRFIHPTEHRGLTLREAAVLQTFPAHYQFEGPYGSIERQIGNAVPVRLAYAIGLIATQLLQAQPAVTADAGRSVQSSTQ